MFEWYVYVFACLVVGVVVYIIVGMFIETLKDEESKPVGDGYMEDELGAG
jgi:hypothetical protein